MKRTQLFLFLLLGLAMVSPAAYAQGDPPPDEEDQDVTQQQRRPNLFAELGLSPDQVRQIRQMNQERRPRMMEARRRMGEASRNLDRAIYADAVSDADIEARLREFQAAEAELSRLRFEGELSVRKVLTPEQLVKFRELRRRFAEMRNENLRNRRLRRGGQDRPPMRDAVPQKRVH